MPSSIYFQHSGKCAANFRNDELNLDLPQDLLNLDVMHKRSTQRNVEQMTAGRFGTAPREFFGETAVRRSNYSVPSRLFLDPYHVSDGNLWAENFLQGRYQKGGMTTSLAGRSKMLKMETERFGKDDPRSRARSRCARTRRLPPALAADGAMVIPCFARPGHSPLRRYVEPEGGRFVPPLKPACARDTGPDPYGTAKHMSFIIKNTGLTGGLGSLAKSRPMWSTHSLSRPTVSR